MGQGWVEVGKGRENGDICNGVSNKNKVKKINGLSQSIGINCNFFKEIISLVYYY